MYVRVFVCLFVCVCVCACVRVCVCLGGEGLGNSIMVGVFVDVKWAVM